MGMLNNANMISHIGGALHAIVLGERFNSATVTTQPLFSNLSYQHPLQTKLYSCLLQFSSPSCQGVDSPCTNYGNLCRKKSILLFVMFFEQSNSTKGCLDNIKKL